MNQNVINHEKRHFSRIAFDSPVRLIKEDRSWESSLIDISLKGVLIQRPINWDESNDKDYKLEINLNADDVEIDMSVKLAHCEAEQIGFHCEEIDMDSAGQLKRLVELNLGDEALLEREINNMLTE